MEISKINSRILKTKLPDLKLGACFICGGAIRDSIIGQKFDDIDIFGCSESDRHKFVDDNLKEAKQIYDSKFLKTYILDGHKIQIIWRDYANLKEMLDSFDYTICQFALGEIQDDDLFEERESGQFVYCNPESLIHLFEKRLVVHELNPQFVANSLERMQKYIKKGYTACNGTIQSLIGGIRSASDKEIEDNFEFYPDGSRKIVRYD